MNFLDIVLDAAFLGSLLLFMGTVATAWLKRRSEKETSRLAEKTQVQQARIDDQKLELEQQKATTEGLNSAVASLQDAVAALRETVAAQQERIRFLAAQQAAEQEAGKKQAEMIAALTVDRDGLVDYAHVLRKHINAELPPPPPPWPNNHKKQQAPHGA